MGFFSELKEDLSQAVSELVPGGNVEEVEEVEAVEVEETVETVAEDSFDMEALLQKAEAEFEEELEAKQQEAVQEEAVPVYSQPSVSYTAPSMDTMDNQGAVATDEVSTITKNVTVNGDLETNGSLDLFGTVNGNIKVLGKMNVTGSINGNSEAAEIFAQKAQINGDVTSLGSVKIGIDSVIRGNIYATSAVIAGAVKGDIDVRGPVILDSTAIVMGNIKSKTVQINNGAAIEGLCSQCYADVSPSKFFRD